eukprot:jgi/Hompol1/1184/HPOL_005528-RA
MPSCDNQTCEIIVKHVVPGGGALLALLVFLSPFMAVRQAFMTGQKSHLNETPYPWIVANCFGWIVYGSLTRDYYLYAANVPGFMLGLWYSLASFTTGGQ